MFNKEEKLVIHHLMEAREHIRLAYQTAKGLSYQVLPHGRDREVISIIDSMIVDGVITNRESVRMPEITKAI